MDNVININDWKALKDFNTAMTQQEMAEWLDQQEKAFSIDDAEREFRKTLVDHGVYPDEEALSVGKLVRCQAINDPPGKKNGWYVFYNDGVPAGSFADWKWGGVSKTWCAKEETNMSNAEIQAYRYRIDKMREIRETERAKLAEEAAARAKNEWGKAMVDFTSHPYLQKKGVQSFGLRISGGKIIVPMSDMEGNLHGVQKIDSSGEKRFTYGCIKKGKFFAIEGKDKIAICEGYATAASVHMATGWACVVAFDAGNLLPVAEEWRKAHPMKEIVICGDDDKAGRENADKAAEAVGGSVIYPRFSKVEHGSATDWNDLHKLSSLDELKRQLEKTEDYIVNIDDWNPVPQLFCTKPNEQEWLVDRTFPMKAVCLLAAMGGAGKSMLTLDLALKVASGTVLPKWAETDFNTPTEAFGNKILASGPVVMFTAEDNLDDIHRRIWSLGAQEPKLPIRIIPLPTAVGPMPLVLPGGHEGLQLSKAWFEIRSQIIKMQPKLIIFDPLASFVQADLNKPEVADFALSLFASLADETGACVLVTHHLAKTRENVSTPEQARALVRGSTAIVDRTRATYVLWHVGEQKGKELCSAIEEEWVREKVYQGCVVKENANGDKSIKTYIRQKSGLLQVKNETINSSMAGKMILLKQELVQAIAKAAEAGQPYTKTGTNGLYAQRADLPEMLQEISRKTFETLAEELLKEGKIVACALVGSSTKSRLDVPGGPAAMGIVKMVPGALEKA